MRIVGLDLSLTSTGLAIVDTGPGGATVLHRVRSNGHKTATLAARGHRLDLITYAIEEHVCPLGSYQHVDLVVVEGPSYGQHRQSGQHDRAGLWWQTVRLAASLADGYVVEVPPATRTKYATGKGNAPKDHVLASVVRRYPHVPVDGNDTADALVLAAMGARHLGVPLEERLPQANLQAMDAVVWPGDGMRRITDVPGVEKAGL